MRKILKTGIYFILFTPLIVSLSFIYQSNTPKIIYFRVLTEMVFGLWIFLAIFNKNYRPKVKNNWFLISIFTFAVILILSSIFGADQNTSFWSSLMRIGGLFTYLHLPILFLVLISVFNTEELFKFLKISVFVSFVVSVVALAQRFIPGFMASYSASPIRPESTLSNPDFLALYLVLFAFLSLGFFFYQDDKIKTNKIILYFYPFAAFINLLVLILTLSRASVFAIAAGAVFLLFIFIFHLKNRKTRLILIILLILVLFIPSFLILNRERVASLAASNSIISGLFQRLTLVYDLSVQSRLATWKIGWDGFKAKPILGWGYENFKLAYSKFFNADIYPQSFFFDWYDKSHNFYVDLLTETGVLGWSGFLFILIVTAINLLKLFRKNTIQSKNFKFFAFFSAAIFAYFFNLIFLFENINTQIVLFLIFALIYKINSDVSAENPLQDVDKKEILKFTKYVIFSFAVISIILLIKLNYNIASAAFYENMTLVSIVKQEPVNDVLSKYNMAIESAPMYKLDLKKEIINKVSEYLSNKDAETMSDNESVYFNKITEIFINDFEKDLKIQHPNDSQYYLILGNLYLLYNKISGNTDYLPKAENILFSGSRLNPGNQYFYITLGMVYEAENKLIDSESAFMKSINANKRSFSGYRDLGLLYITMGKLNEAVQMMDKALILGYVPHSQSEIDMVAGVYYKNKLYKPLINWYGNLLNNSYDQNTDYWVKLAVAMKAAGYPKNQVISTVNRAVGLDPTLKQEAEIFINSIR